MRYRDAPAAIEWLERAFGFERHVVYEGAGGTVDHAELRYGEGLVMLGSVRGEDDHRLPGRGWAYVAVEDIQTHHDRAKAAGAEIVGALEVHDYGSFYGAHDLEGNLWSFGTYRPGRPEA